MKVYVAGPMTWGDKIKNIKQGIDAATQLVQAGHAPFVPHQSHLWALMTPMEDQLTHEEWLAYDYVWLMECEALIRLPGRSKGADQEMRWARRHSIPTFKSVKDFLEWTNEQLLNDE